MSDFKHRIFEEFYSLYDKQSDPNKDANGKGTQQRYTEVWGASVDDTVLYIDGLLSNVIDPLQRYNSLVSYREEELGYRPEWIWFYEMPISFRKHLTVIMPRLLEIRSTLPAYVTMFKWLGISMTMTEELDYLGGFDNPLVRLDSPLRRFDSYTKNDINYSVDLTGPVVTIVPTGFPITLPYLFDPLAYFKQLIRAIYTILLFNQPVNFKLESATYNGVDILSDLKAITPNHLQFA